MDDGIGDTFVSVDGASGVGCYSATVSRFASLAEAAIVMLEMIFPKREECEAGAPPMFRRKVPGWGSARSPNLILLCPRWEDRMSDPGRKLPRRIHVIRVSPRAGAARGIASA